jgi:ribose/xylose/arabinose/galactoside ABC-type transport system permease subunit
VTVFTAFAISGCALRTSGFHVSGSASANITVTAAQGLELQVVAAVVVGWSQHLRRVRLDGRGPARCFDDRDSATESVTLAGISEFVKDAIRGLLILSR